MRLCEPPVEGAQGERGSGVGRVLCRKPSDEREQSDGKVEDRKGKRAAEASVS